MANQQPDPQLLAVALAYQTQTTDIRDRVLSFIAMLWRSLGVYRDPQMKTFKTQLLPVVIGAERHMASLTSSYLATVRQLQVGGFDTPASVDLSRVTGTATRNGAAPELVYERPFTKVWRELRDGTTPEDAISRGLSTAQKAAVTDIQRTKILTANDVIRTDRAATWYERILEGTQSCGLCIVASTQRYHKAKLLPIHPGCDCSVTTRYGDPGDEPLNQPRLEAVHDAIETTFGASDPGARRIADQYIEGRPLTYRDVLIEHEHGELGPVLAVKGHKFTGPNDLP